MLPISAGVASQPGGTAFGNASALPARAGIGLKPEHFRQILESWPDVGFFEVHAENYMVDGGPFHHYLTRIRERYPLSLHGVGLSIGGETAPDREHLRRLAALIDRYQPQSFSEHLAWSGHGEVFLNDLFPVVYDRQNLERVCDHVDLVQMHLKCRMLLENPATYLEFSGSTMPETDFMAEVSARTGCGLLLDVNNVYVSCVNHYRDPRAVLHSLMSPAVSEIHLAGFAEERGAAGERLLIDTHGAPVAHAVWALYRLAIAQLGPVATLIERDHDIPPLDMLIAEAAQAEQILRHQDPQRVCRELA